MRLLKVNNPLLIISWSGFIISFLLYIVTLWKNELLEKQTWIGVILMTLYLFLMILSRYKQYNVSIRNLKTSNKNMYNIIAALYILFIVNFIINTIITLLLLDSDYFVREISAFGMMVYFSYLSKFIGFGK